MKSMMHWILFFGLAIEQSGRAELPTYKKNPEDFFYAQQTSLSIFYQVPKKTIRQHIGDTLDSLGFEIASFEDDSVGYLVLKPMVFISSLSRLSMFVVVDM